MVLLSVLAPSSKPVDPLHIDADLTEQVAMHAVVTTLQVQNAMGQQIAQLLEANAGTLLNRSACFPSRPRCG